ncbi:hypothetical protein AZE42_11834 [Rhizopogon vesiculosus]|uniref:Uncharacterized protein n=1 Tax=Rhizopogon vesiculosus TaxID=180088 RepID=A0A1J8QKM3_9AGAM|nr:hypothetical protein AZE42_11834 [Rhizopogon vesiculosus]
MPATPSPADACTPMPATSHPAEACDVTSRTYMQFSHPAGACNNPTASSSPQCVTCRLL